MSCFPKPLKEEDNDEEAQQRPSTKASSQKSVIHNPQYEAVLKNIRTQELKDFQQLRMMAFRRRSLLKKPGLNENLRLWLSIEVGELASFDEKQLKRVVSENAEQTTPEGESLVHLASQRGSTQILKLAIKAIPREKRVAFINSASQLHEPPLLLAAQNGHRDCVKALLRAGSDVNKVNNSGETALYLACYHGHRDVVLELVRHPKVDVERLSEEAASAYGVSLMKRHMEIARLVRWRGLWPCFRLLWLAKKKNRPSKCPLASLPDSFIKSVIHHIVFAEVAQLTAVK